MKKSYITGLTLSAAVVALLAGAPSFADNDHDEGDVVTRAYDFTGFDKVKVGGVYDVSIVQGRDYSISLSGNSAEMERIKVWLDGDTLRLGTEKDKKKRKRRKNQKGVDVSITMPSLQALGVSGVAEVNAREFDAGDFDLNLSGVAEVTLAGTCESLDAKVSGVGELDARDFKCKTADVSLSGVGEVDVYASEAIDIKASGVGDVAVYGNPERVSKSKGMFTEVKLK